MRDFNYALKQLCLKYPEGSFNTRRDRERILTLIANQLHEMGFRQMQVDSLKPKHVQALVNRWKAEGIAAGTFKNRMWHLRWLAEKTGKEAVIARKNDDYGIPRRQYVTYENRARELTTGDLENVTDPYVRMSLRLQAAFGLRRKESLMIRPAKADRGNWLFLQQSWTKGGRERRIPIRTDEQRQLLEAAKALAGRGSLIPRGLTYVKQLNRYSTQLKGAGIHKAHGHRHLYAQTRYRELTGWSCRLQGGPSFKELSREQRKVDHEARLTISNELGHGRISIVAVYISR